MSTLLELQHSEGFTNKAFKTSFQILHLHYDSKRFTLKLLRNRYFQTNSLLGFVYKTLF